MHIEEFSNYRKSWWWEFECYLCFDLRLIIYIVCYRISGTKDKTLFDLNNSLKIPLTMDDVTG